MKPYRKHQNARGQYVRPQAPPPSYESVMKNEATTASPPPPPKWKKWRNGFFIVLGLALIIVLFD